MDEVRTSGCYQCDGTRSFGDSDSVTRAAYDWIISVLAEKSPRPYGCIEPVWCWYRIDGIDNKKPDMRRERWVDGEPRDVDRINLDIDESRVLLSDFDLWHIPLNSGYFGTDDADDDEFYDELEQNGIKPWLLFNKTLKQDIHDKNVLDSLHASEQAVRDTWYRCLFPECERYTENGRSQYVQGVFWEIHEKDIISSQRFHTMRRRMSTASLFK